MRILFVGDVVGRPGRVLLKRALPVVCEHHRVHLVVANVENAAGGSGITRETAEEILAAGVQVMTTGNHVWDKREVIDFIAHEPRLLRPLNYPAAAPGRGELVVTLPESGHRVAVVNAMGRVHMSLVDDPFAAVSAALDRLKAHTATVLVDFHAEATSEKIAMGWFLDGRVTALVGTHTHVQTADDRVLPGGTAYITDVGMTGPHDSVIGVEKEAALARFLTGLPSRFETASGDPRMHAVLIDADPASGKATAIERLALDVPALLAMAAQSPAPA